MISSAALLLSLLLLLLSLLLLLPQAVLVVGFLPEEYEAFRAMMVDIEADMVKVQFVCNSGFKPEVLGYWGLLWCKATHCVVPLLHSSKCG
jgi:hypothetical protein